MTQIDLISNEWSDLLFENRNREYGAYVLRQQTSNRNLASIMVMLGLVALLVGLIVAKNKLDETRSQHVVHDSVIEITNLTDKKPEVKRNEVVKHEEVEQVVEKVINSIKFVAPIIMKDSDVDPTEEMKTQDEIMSSKVAIGVFDVIGNSDDGEVLRVKQMVVGEEVKPKEPSLDKPFDVVEQMPSFPGGTPALMAYLQRSIKYPAIAEENGIQGRVICQFIVERDGSVTDIHIIKSVDPSLDKEAQRVIASMPKWIPGRQNGQAVRVKFTLPVTFRLQ